MNSEDVNWKLIEEMVSNPRNLTLQVVQKVLDYKNELNKLLMKNNYLETEINHLKYLLSVNREEKEILKEHLKSINESDNKDEQLKKLIEKDIKFKNSDKLCFTCQHSLECGDVFLCCYCKKYVCGCCRVFCSSKDHNYTDSSEKKCENCNGYESLCIFSMCIECNKFANETCVKHNKTLTKEESEPLVEYFMKNRYKKGCNSY